MGIVTALNALAKIDMRDGIAILRMARAPSNALAAAYCDQLHDIVSAQLRDDAVQGFVLASDLAVFSAGSDVADILTPVKGGRAALGRLCRLLAGAPKPVVAAIGGACLSTGFDLALAAQARVAGAQASFGFPDVRLGLLPAGGGAYRLTRLIGVQAALDILLTGAAKPAEEALETGLIDHICSAGKEIDVAADLARAMAAPQTGARPPLVRRAYEAALPEDMAAIAQARAGLPAKVGPWAAHHSLVDLMESAILLPEDAALAQDALFFQEVQQGPIARALCYAFVARQRAAKDHQTTAANADYANLKAMLRQTVTEVIAMFCDQGLPQEDVMTALAAFGITTEVRAQLPACPEYAEDVVPALLAAWANLGAKMLRQGFAPRADVVDYAALAGNMCPNWRGGPMYLADLRGAMVVRAELRRRSQGDDPRAQVLFKPDPLWDALIAQSIKLGDVQKVSVQTKPS